MSLTWILAVTGPGAGAVQAAAVAGAIFLVRESLQGAQAQPQPLLASIHAVQQRV